MGREEEAQLKVNDFSTWKTCGLCLSGMVPCPEWGGPGQQAPGQCSVGGPALQSVEGEQHEKAVELLKAAQGSVKLVVRYTPRVLEEMEARFEKMRSARRRQQHQSYT